MRKAAILKKPLMMFTLVVFLTQTLACGTLLYPERRGQRSGRIDPGVAILDGVGLLLFIIPGLVAYAIDFSTGAIYLPRGKSSSAPDDDGVKVVYVNPEELNETTIRNVIIREAGMSGSIDLGNSEVWILNGIEEIPGAFADIKKSGVLDRHSIVYENHSPGKRQENAL